MFGRVPTSSTMAERIKIIHSQDASADELVRTMLALSSAQDLHAIMRIVRSAARRLVGSDGATFVLRDGDQCHYADEDAIAPLWKGQRFPMSACISGWVMFEGRPAVIPDIYQDDRIPADAYRPTFVKSLAMIPIRPQDPLGAIGAYWADHHEPSPRDVELLQALANGAAIAVENVGLRDQMEQRIRERTIALENAIRDLEAFSTTVSHDLRSPLTGLSYLIGMTLRNGDLDAPDRERLEAASRAAEQIAELLDGLRRLASTPDLVDDRVEIDLTKVARRFAMAHRHVNPGHGIAWDIAEGLRGEGDAQMLQVVMQNLLSNATKFTASVDAPRITVDSIDDGETVYRVHDNGIGFPPDQAERLFDPFYRAHGQDEYAGSGLGLATARRIVERHGGRIWAESVPEGAMFCFTLGLAEV